MAGPDGDAEVIALGGAALAATGLPSPTIDLGHLGLAREVLGALELPPRPREEARRRIAKRDGAGLERVLRGGARLEGGGPLRGAAARAVGPAVDAGRAPSSRRRPRASARARRSGAHRRARSRRAGIEARLHVDLGEVRGFDYYTGLRFQASPKGAPDAVLGGGRYDDLLGRYGRPSPAVGFAVDVEAAAAALEAAHAATRGNGATNGNGRSRPRRGKAAGSVLVAGPAGAALRHADALRAGGKRVAVDSVGLSPRSGCLRAALGFLGSHPREKPR